jgi:hypothetical protein
MQDLQRRTRIAVEDLRASLASIEAAIHAHGASEVERRIAAGRFQDAKAMMLAAMAIIEKELTQQE